MKISVLIVLCGAMLLDGCYSYSVLETEDKNQQLPPDNESIVVTLKNGSVIESEARHHIVVDSLSNFIYGVGISRKNNVGGEFAGRIDPSYIDSGKAISFNDLHYQSFWLKDSSRILFMEGDYVTVSPDQGTGLWCMGRKSDGKSDSAFTGKVVFGNVRSIEIKNISVGKSMGLGALLGAAGGLLIAAVTRPGMSNGGVGMADIVYIVDPLGMSLLGLLAGAIVAAAW